MAMFGTKTFWIDDHRWLTVDWIANKNDQDPVANTTTINYMLQLYTGSKGSISDFFMAGVSIYDSNDTYITHSRESINSIGNNSNVIIAQGVATIPHNEDGTGQFSYDVSYQLHFGSNSNWKDGSFKDNIETIDKIDRGVSIQSITASLPSSSIQVVWDIDSPVVTYLNYAGSAASSLQLRVEALDGTTLVDNKNIPKGSGGSAKNTYTLTFTNDDLESIYSYLNYKKTYTTQVYFILESEVSGVSYQSKIPAEIRLIGYMPTINPKVVDGNSDTLRLTGDENTLVQYMSDAVVEAGFQANKGAYIESQSIRNGTEELEYDGTFQGVKSNTFYFSVTDSRGYTTNDFVVFNNLNNRKWIPYSKLTCSCQPGAITAKGELEVTITGKYFNGSFGATNNKMVLEYDIHPAGGYGNWTYYGANGVVTPTVDDDYNYTYKFKITGLDYTTTYKIAVRVADELMTATTIERVVVSDNTLFDWGKTDFNFNIPVQMNKGYMYPQTILWSGVSQLTSSEADKVVLDQPISSQPSGIVLIFSLYRNGAADDVSIHQFFVSRIATQYLFTNGGEFISEPTPHLFMLGINANLSVFGSKYVYISDTELTGFDANANSGTSECGIKFNNGSFVLRYVIGV